VCRDAWACATRNYVMSGHARVLTTKPNNYSAPTAERRQGHVADKKGTLYLISLLRSELSALFLLYTSYCESDIDELRQFQQGRGMPNNQINACAWDSATILDLIQIIQKLGPRSLEKDASSELSVTGVYSSAYSKFKDIRFDLNRIQVQLNLKPTPGAFTHKELLAQEEADIHNIIHSCKAMINEFAQDKHLSKLRGEVEPSESQESVWGSRESGASTVKNEESRENESSHNFSDELASKTIVSKPSKPGESLINIDKNSQALRARGFNGAWINMLRLSGIQDPHVWKFNPYKAQGYVPVPSDMIQFATQAYNINRVCRFTLPLGNVVRDWQSHPKHFSQTYMANWIRVYSAVADSLAPYQRLKASCITGNPADNTGYRIMAPAQAGGTHMMCRTILNKLEDSLLFYFMVPQDVRETMSCAICNRQIPPALGS